MELRVPMLSARDLPMTPEYIREKLPYGAPSSTGVRCLYCSSVDCRRSVRHGMRDFLRQLAGMFPWRCDGCRQRFYLRKRSLG
jgi:hypothetical protein